MERLTTILTGLALALAACAGEGNDTAGDSTTTTGGSSTSSTSSTTTTTTGGESSSTTGAPVGCEAAAAWCFTEFTDEACDHCRVECNELAAENICSQWQECVDLSGWCCPHFWCVEGLLPSADEESRIGICTACVEACGPSAQEACKEHL